MTFAAAIARKGGIARRLIKRLGAAGLVLALLISASLVTADYHLTIQRSEERFQQIEASYLASITENLWLQDSERLGQLITGIRQFPHVQHVRITDEQGAVVAETGQRTESGEMRRSYVLTRPFSGKILDIGRLDVSMNKSGMLAQVTQRAWILLMANILLMAGILVALYWQVYRLVARPLDRMASQVRQLNLEQTGWDMPLDTSSDELRDLATAYAEMRHALNQGYHAIRASEEHLRIMFENSPVSLWEEDFSGVKAELDELRATLDGGIEDYLETHPDFVSRCAARVIVVNVNRATLALHRATDRADLLGHLERTFTAASFQAFSRQLVAIWNGETQLSAEGEVKTLDGEQRIVLIHWQVPHGHEARLDRVIVALEDITERKNAERNLAQSRDKLLRTHRDLERMTEITAHDLQEPMRGIVSFSQLLERRAAPLLDAESRNILEYLVTAGRRMQEQIRGLLDYAQTAPADADIRPAGLDDGLHQALERLAPVIASRQASIETAPLPMVMANEAMLAELFTRLLDNALKFTRPDKPPRITITASHHQDMVTVTIADHGIGILPSYADEVFHVFRRLHGPEQFAGIGVGLAISRKIVDRLGGRIWVDTTVTEGCTLHFTLPQAPE